MPQECGKRAAAHHRSRVEVPCFVGFRDASFAAHDSFALGASSLILCSMNAPILLLTPHDERRVAVAAGCDPRSVRAYLRRARTRSTTAARIAEALRTLGFRATQHEPERAHD